MEDIDTATTLGALAGYLGINHWSTLASYDQSVDWVGPDDLITALEARVIACAWIADTLSYYDGDNIWQDVILGLPGYDPAATGAVDHHYTSDGFVADGIVYRLNHSSGEWVGTDDADE